MGTVALVRGSKRPHAGACGETISARPGRYIAEVSLDGALDKPVKRKSVSVVSGQVAELRLDFSTGSIEVDARNGDRRIAALVRIENAEGQRIATVAAGVRGHLSTGTYNLVATYRSKEKRLKGVRVAKGKRKVVRIDF